MASKRRLRRNKCTGKAAHDTYENALIAIKKTNGSGLLAYKCSFCGKYHIGHMPYRVYKELAVARI